MNKLFKEWRDMTPEQKKTEKIAITAMGIILTIIASLFLVACCL